MTDRKKQRIAIAQMLICAALWSIAGIFIKLIDWNPMVISGFRGLFAAVTVGVYMLITKQRLFLSKQVLLCAFFLAATFSCFVVANKLTTAANAIVLQFTSPIFIILFSALLFRQKFRTSDYLTVLLTFCGIAVFFVSGLRAGQLAGNIVGMLAGVFMAGMYLSVSRTDAIQKMSGIFFGQVLTALIGIPFVFFTRGTVTTLSVVFIVILGVVQIGIPYILLALASNRCPPLACSLIGALEPLLNPVWVLIFAGENPGIFSLIGGVIVIGAVTAQCVLQDKRAAGERPPEKTPRCAG
ncbi:Threonine/homoserine efflux transporter RhtA [Sporobacter termitidis DSM 10068]|uniref:Threonine/homoserine efflux transporter RhtA n=1 Tax=Sporobacter termitidis DSM 10068 TaxID=1123282 RepID=A0A1M5UDK4_9FIRM|nr:DMT family transporter [Sporobacter termitidis]SHH61020.1 Threonine/homoserine efflux transporter RhtA [Sporobacter termitidis DSM 10068]